MARAHAREFESFADFYPYYLSEHRDRTCRRLHFVGSTVALICLLMMVVTGSAWWLPGAVVSGYAFAWVGHFVFEKNRPATFRHPVYSLMGDWVMYGDILRGRISF
ncbi:hypothetical protein LMG23992_02191 [Cupriavidus laharis]|uniref:DUF962 domain-containing protein n=1 Tax=Cupriavidus laharis TaxID=151654 RepID=A0ABM8WXQ5_9BURK|nr:Mpo1-like protein [Cupriavidus laharis]CAG9172318.1 hypothetical protein LMG23992_02191 [Cupriavidus laharis]